MQRKPNITWRNSDTKKLEHQIKNFNAKVYYQRKKHPDVADILPQPIHKSDKLAMMEDLKQKRNICYLLQKKVNLLSIVIMRYQ
jgi:hypothetical protein